MATSSMKQTSRFPPLLSAKFIILVGLGFLIPLATSLFVGTRSFNHYCSKALVGKNIGSYIFDPEKSGFKDCLLNTLTLDPYVFILVLYGALFVLHVCLITQFKEKKIVKNLARIFLISVLFVASYQLTQPLFQQIHYNPWAGMVSITQGKALFFSPSSLSLSDLLSLPVWGLLFLAVFQSGPIVMTFLLNRFKLSYGYKPGTKSFLYVFAGAALFQLLAFVVALSIFSLSVRIASPKPAVHQFPQPPKQVFSLEDR